LPEKHREALALNVKAPLVYTNVLVRNWRAWINLGMHDIHAPMSFFSRIALDFPVSLEGYRHARDPADIAAITVDRWPHGYGYVANSLFDSDDYDKTVELARRPFGRVAIANSDSGGDAYAHLAIDAAARAVSELLD
jgi:spermidine dehydrogenase